MARIHLGLSIWATAFFLGEGTLGFFSRGRADVFSWHFTGGVLVALFICAVHTIVMFHFIGSGSELKDLALLLGRDASIYDRVRKFKSVVFPGATFSMLVTIAAEVAGGAVHAGVTFPLVHGGLVAIALTLNLYTFYVEYVTLKANEALIDESSRKIKALMTPDFIRDLGKA